MGRVSLHLHGSSIFYRDKNPARIGAVMGTRGMDDALHGQIIAAITLLCECRTLQIQLVGGSVVFRRIRMTEQEMEDLLWNYPDKFLNEPLTPFRRQPTSEIGRADVVFKDRLDRLLVIEIKKGKLERGAIDQLLDYFGMLKKDFPDVPVELMVVANRIPEERQLACTRHDIVCVEIPEKKFRDVAAEVGYT